MAKKKGYPLGTFMKEFGTEKKCRSIWQICGGQTSLSARNAAAATLARCLMTGIDVPSAAGKPQ